MKIVNVAVGVVKKSNSYFVCKRKLNQHQGGLWEFPGGKIEDGESVTQALKRELKEEIGIVVNDSYELVTVLHEYPDKHVCLHVHVVEDFSGSPTGAEGQEHQWVASSQLHELDFPDANKVILENL